MPPITERSKYTDVAGFLEADVRTGRWDGMKMPSVRKVASTYHVSVVTASRALQVLRDKGLVRTIERSGCYRVPPPDADRWAVVLRLTPGPMIGMTTSLVRDGFESIARGQPMHLHFDSFLFGDHLSEYEAGKAAAAAKANGIHGVVLLPSRSPGPADVDRAFVAGCQNAGLPIVLYERGLLGDTDSSSYDLVAIDDVNTTVQAMTHLHEIGRTSIACVTASDMTSHRERVAGYLYSHYTQGAKNKPAVYHQDTTVAIGEAYAKLATAIIKGKHDAVVCYSDYTALGLINELERRGKGVPQDVAVVGFDNLLIGEQFSVQLTTVKYSTSAMAAAAVQALKQRRADPQGPRVRISIPGQLIVRTSTVA